MAEQTAPAAEPATPAPYKPPDEQATYASALAALHAMPGKANWTIVGIRPYYVNEPNADAVGSQPKASNVVRGAYVSVQGPNGEPDEIVIGPSDKSVIWDLSVDANGQMKPLQASVVVLKGPQNNPPSPGTQPGSPISDWTRLDASGQIITDPSKPATYIRDPKAPSTTQPFRLEDDQKLGDPKTWEPITNPNDPAKSVVGYYDPKTGKLAASVPAAPNRQPSGKFDNFIDPNDPAHKRVIAVIDQGDSSVHPVSQIDNKQIVTTPTAIYVVDKDSGASTLVQTVDKSSPFQAAVIDGVRYIFDPNETDKSKSFTRDPNQSKLAPTMKGSDGTEWVLVEDPNDPSGLGGHYVRPPGITKPATVDAPAAAALEYIIYRDENGKEVSRSKNPNWQGYAQPGEPTLSTTAKQIPTWNRTTGQWDWGPNPNRLVASEALRAMAQQVTGQIISGDISEDEAYKLLTAANAKMANDIAQQNATLSAAQTAITAGQQGAQTGAGLLNQRVQAGSAMLGQVLGFAGQSHLRGLPEGSGQAIMQDIQGFATQLGGGQDVYDTAVRLIHAADPTAPNELTAKATAYITQVLNKQIEQTGQIPPVVQVTQQLKANLASGQGGMPAPPAPIPTPSPAWQRADQQYGAAPAGNALAPAGVAGTVAPGSPMYLGWQAPPAVIPPAQTVGALPRQV